MRIEICAPLGTGKTTLATRLATRLGWGVSQEAVEQHPYLKSFYSDPVKYGYETSVFFALDHIHRVKKMADQNTIFDAGHLLNQSYDALRPMKEAERENLKEIYKVVDSLPPPDLIIVLDLPSSMIMDRIRGRKRDIENGLPEEYIVNLQKEINKSVASLSPSVPVLRLDARDINLITSPEDIEKVVTSVAQKITLGTFNGSAKKNDRQFK